MAYDAALREEHLKWVQPLSKRIGKKASVYAKEIVAALKAELAAKKITANEFGTKQLRMLDSFIVNRLPIPKETKKLALQRMGYEAVLTSNFAMVMMGKPLTRIEVISMLENAVFTVNNLSSPYEKVLTKHVNLEEIHRIIKGIKKGKAQKVILNPEVIIAAKVINTAAVREALGEEMSNAYAIAYKQAKYVMANEIERQLG